MATKILHTSFALYVWVSSEVILIKDNVIGIYAYIYI